MNWNLNIKKTIANTLNTAQLLKFYIGNNVVIRNLAFLYKG